MKLVILRSQKCDADKKPEGAYLQEFNTYYADRVIGNLLGHPDFCTSCAADCIACRKPYRRNFSRDIARVISFPSVLPYVLEQPGQYVPNDIPRHDALLAIHVHEQILVEVVKQCSRLGTKCIVVPTEEPHWITNSARAQATAICDANGIEIAFPKPFCGFKPTEGSVLDKFRRHFHIGYPEVELAVENGRITKANVVASAACGSTYYIARWLVGRSLEDDIAIEVISKRLHSFPCTASMERDPELDDDTALHIAGKAHNTILTAVKESVHEEIEMVVSPLGRRVQKAVSPTDTLRNIDTAKRMILGELQSRPSVTLDQLRKTDKKITPAAIHSALLLLKKEGKIRTERQPGSPDQFCKGGA